MTNSSRLSKAAEQVLLRRKVRSSFRDWCVANGFTPALHHDLMIRELQDVAEGRNQRLMFLVPPGSAKSTYSSVLFPPWYLCRHPRNLILACSYSATLATRFGKRCRNLVEQQSHLLGYTLAKDSQAADDWQTSIGGTYFCSGVGAGIAGHRADLGLIDDYLGSQEDADSEVIREKQWDWYVSDFVPRLKPSAGRIIIANRRHEEDLVGLILAREAHLWRIVRLPMLAEEHDPLGRSPGDRLWPEWYTQDMVREAQMNPRIWAGLYQQRPAPEQGDYFRKEWLQGYEPQDLPSELRIYGSGDFAVSEETHANKSCFLLGGQDSNGILWILPQAYWEKSDAKGMVDGLFNLVSTAKPITFFAEKGHISKSIMPFLRERMLAAGVYVNIEEITPVRDKPTRARSIQGKMSMGMVRFPKFAPWWADAEWQLLTAFNTEKDDFPDALGLLGLGLDRMVKAPKPLIDVPFCGEVFNENTGAIITGATIRRWHREQQREEELTRLDM